MNAFAAMACISRATAVDNNIAWVHRRRRGILCRGGAWRGRACFKSYDLEGGKHLSVSSKQKAEKEAATSTSSSLDKSVGATIPS